MKPTLLILTVVLSVSLPPGLLGAPYYDSGNDIFSMTLGYLYCNFSYYHYAMHSFQVCEMIGIMIDSFPSATVITSTTVTMTIINAMNMPHFENCFVMSCS